MNHAEIEDLRRALEAVREAANDYDSQAEAYNERVREHQDTLEDMFADLKDAANIADVAHTVLSNALSDLQNAVSELDIDWGELRGDPRKAHRRRAIDLLQHLIGDALPAAPADDLPDAPDLTEAGTLDVGSSMWRELRALVEEIAEDATEDVEDAEQLEAPPTTAASVEELEAQVRTLTAELQALRAPREGS
jgi:DNA repair ATPase RecN